MPAPPPPGGGGSSGRAAAAEMSPGARRARLLLLLLLFLLLQLRTVAAQRRPPRESGPRRGPDRNPPGGAPGVAQGARSARPRARPLPDSLPGGLRRGVQDRAGGPLSSECSPPRPPPPPADCDAFNYKSVRFSCRLSSDSCVLRLGSGRSCSAFGLVLFPRSGRRQTGSSSPQRRFRPGRRFGLGAGGGPQAWAARGPHCARPCLSTSGWG